MTLQRHFLRPDIASPPDVGRVRTHRLKNGLRVVCHSDPASPVVTLNLLYHVGSRHERRGMKGYAHLFEHLMFDGSRHLKRGEYDLYCTRAGGENNAWTSQDMTDYWITLPAEHLRLGLFLESDRMSGFSISAESLATQIDVVQAEKRQVIDTVPYGEEGMLMRELLYADDHPYRHEPIGLIDDIKKASLEEMRWFYEQFYVPNNATLAIVGPYDPEYALELVEEYFGSIPQGLPSPELESPDPSLLRSGERRTVKDGQVPLKGVFLGWHLPDLRSDELLALELLSMILADGESSRMSLALEYDPLIASESSAYVEEGELGSVFCAYGIAQNNRISPARLEEKILGEIKKIVRDGISPRELRKVKNRKISTIIQGLQSASNRAEQLAWYATIFDDPSLLWSEALFYEEVTSERIIAAADHYLHSVLPTAIEYYPV